MLAQVLETIFELLVNHVRMLRWHEDAISCHQRQLGRLEVHLASGGAKICIAAVDSSFPMACEPKFDGSSASSCTSCEGADTRWRAACLEVGADKLLLPAG